MKQTFLLALLGACAWAQTAAPKAAGTAKTGASRPGAARKSGAGAASSSAKLMNPAAWTKQAPPEFKAKLTTTKGDIVINVHRDWSPMGADRFYNLVRSGFFTNVSFYRVVPKFIVQFGTAADPKVGAAWKKAKIKDDPVKHTNTKYSITYAKPNLPDNRTTELFINLKDNAFLDADGFSPFGEVVEGQDVVDQIYSGYGEMSEQPGGAGPSQGRLEAEGKAYLDKSFPKLDSIKSAAVISGEAPAAPAAKPAKSAAPTVKKTMPIHKKSEGK